MIDLWDRLDILKDYLVDLSSRMSLFEEGKNGNKNNLINFT